MIHLVHRDTLKMNAGGQVDFKKGSGHEEQQLYTGSEGKHLRLGFLFRLMVIFFLSVLREVEFCIF